MTTDDGPRTTNNTIDRFAKRSHCVLISPSCDAAGGFCGPIETSCPKQKKAGYFNQPSILF